MHDSAVIAASLRGGLGNQIFEYAAGRSLALRHGTELALDVSELGRASTSRRPELDCFEIDAPIVGRVHSWEELDGPRSLRARLARRGRRHRPGSLRILRQKGLEFQPAYFDAPDDTHLLGFWQSERYFVEHAEAIRRDLRFRRAPTGPLARLLDEIAVRPSVSVHVRRGDYVSDPVATAFHGVLAGDYYGRALARVAELEDVHAFVFSDDLAWCRQHLQLAVPASFVDVGAAPADDLRLMAACKHHVIANSSFSWWGAWLGRADGGVVVAPRAWVADPTVDTSHVVPDRWIRV